MKRIGFLATVLGPFIAIFAPIALAQTGSISGIIADPSGAVVPKAEVTATSPHTGFKRTLLANDAGFYVFNQLPVGAYVISASMPGFKTSSSREMDLHVADQRTVNIVLPLEAAAQSVTVTSGAAEVNLRSGEVSSLVSAEQVSELPLNGRNFTQLTLLVPGASPPDGMRPSATGILAVGNISISMSGSVANSNLWLVDGVDNMDHGAGWSLLVFPSVDAVEEFKVQRNSYGAENAGGSGAQITVVTKSGTNAFHGTAYEFLRNDLLNANNFFLNRAGIEKRPELRYNNFGYSLGGPIKKDKVFFFWSEEWRREVRGVARSATVPTEAEHRGNFSGLHSANLPTPVDPMTGERFPGDTIPAARLSPAGQAYMKLLPPPTSGAAVNNWVTALPTGIPTRQEQIRVDSSLSANTQLMFRYTQESWRNPALNYGTAGGLWGDTGFPTVDSSWAQPSKSLAARLTHTFGPTAVNQFQFGYSNNRIIASEGVGEDISRAIIAAVPAVFGDPPKTHFSGIWVGAPLAGSAGPLWHLAPWDDAQDIWSWKDDFAKTSGNHNLKIGALYARYLKDQDMIWDTAPSFWGAAPGGAGMGGGWGDSRAPGNGHGGVTDNVVADFLLKDTWWADGFEISNPSRSKVRWHDVEVYFADTWRARPRLTVDYGVRWSLLPPSFDADGKMGNWIPALWDPTVGNSAPLNGMIFPENLVMKDQGILGGKDNLRGVEVGKALRKSGWKIVAPRLGIAWDPRGSGKWAVRAGAGMFYGRADMGPVGEMSGNPPFISTLLWPAGRPLDYFPADIPTAGVGLPSVAVDTNSKLQGSYQWNFAIEHELMKGTKIELAYVGNRGHHLPFSFNLNQAPSSAWMEYARRLWAPDMALGDPQKLRAWFDFKGSQGLSFITQGANSSYHALQLFVSRRFSNSLSYQFAYTFSKVLANQSMTCCSGGGNEIYSAEAPWYNRGPGSFDRTNIVSFNAVYRLPALNKNRRAVRYLLGGWEITSIYLYGTGVPLTPAIYTNMLGILGNRPDLIGNPHLSHPTAEKWFNTDAFGVPRLGKLGTSGMGYIRAPAINNMDLAVYKNFKLTERTKLQLRFESFNTLNHTQLKYIDTSFVLPSGLVANAGDSYNSFLRPATCRSWPNCQSNANFGQARAVRDPRELQLALKLIW